MRKKERIIIFLFTILISHFAFSQSIRNAKWDFDDLKEWILDAQSPHDDNLCYVKKGILNLTIKGGSSDIEKINSSYKDLTTGRYTWRVFVSDLEINEKTSIGASISFDEQHALCFEVGYGRPNARARMKANADEYLVFMMSKGEPYSCIRKPIKPGWHTFCLDLTLVENNYHVDWIIDDEIANSIQLTYGTDYPFSIGCSVAKLDFFGDSISQKDHCGQFDYVEYTYHK